MPSCVHMQFFTRNPIFRSKMSKSGVQSGKIRKNLFFIIYSFRFSSFFTSNRRISLFLTSKSDSSWKTVYIDNRACLESSNLVKNSQNRFYSSRFSSIFTSNCQNWTFSTWTSDSCCKTVYFGSWNGLESWISIKTLRNWFYIFLFSSFSYVVGCYFGP